MIFSIPKWKAERCGLRIYSKPIQTRTLKDREGKEGGWHEAHHPTLNVSSATPIPFALPLPS